MPEPLVVRRETHVAAPPAAVFALLTDPEKILRWMGTEAQMEPRPGGLYLLNVTGARFARGSIRDAAYGGSSGQAGASRATHTAVQPLSSQALWLIALCSAAR